VGNGMVVDVSKYMTRILEINVEEKWVRVQPGVVLDELNQELAKHKLFFGPETSTSSRCMMGGMVGNNSCGARSMIYGSTRDHVLSLNCILSDGSQEVFSAITPQEFEDKCEGDKLVNSIYRNIREILANRDNQHEIRLQYPDKSLHRRNTGYAMDVLLESEVFTKEGEKFNFCKLLAGSEGTLAFTTEIKLNLVPLPPLHKALVCVHHQNVRESLQANILAQKHQPVSIELIDKILIECTENSPSQRENMFFIKGLPGAILVVEFFGESEEDVLTKARNLIEDFKNHQFGYHFPVLTGSDMQKIWNLRKAGLGLLSNIPGDAKPVPVVEDTAVGVDVLPEYIDDFSAMLDRYGLSCVYYAHVGSGELHLRPVLDLKSPEGVKLFHTVAYETARLVKKYKGSLSGEHGDGRLRGEFIEFMIGSKNYHLLHEIKNCWDPDNIFNPNKIVNTPKMNTSLRYPADFKKDYETIFDFSEGGGFLRSIEKCNGSGDCRKSALIGGVMCPSFMATRDESNSTRARANILREYLTYSPLKNPFEHREIYEVLDLCLSCKGCKSECPSNIDMTKYKAEFLQHYYDKHGIPFRTSLIAHIDSFFRLGSLMPGIYNSLIINKMISGLIKRIIGFASERKLPEISKINLKKFFRVYQQEIATEQGSVWLFADEFTNYNDVKIGIAAIRLLNKLGYRVGIPDIHSSGRAFLSKGLLRKARKIANQNVTILSDCVSVEKPLIGIEPSAILSFRDEYPALVDGNLKEKAQTLKENCLLFDEFFMREVQKGNINREAFSRENLQIKFHGHCHQKAIASTKTTLEMLSFPANYSVSQINAGCCGMAGSFGYEKEHYKLSMEIANLKLLPEIKNTPRETILAALGTSCRDQIRHGSDRDVYHPVEIMYMALK
jgi:FAD/FMN-containing dehydrogenase/Fe-S oxidoreductase